MSLLPERSSQDQVVQVAFPAVPVIAVTISLIVGSKFEVLAADVEGGEVVSTRGLNLERGRMRADVGRDVLRGGRGGLPQLGLIGRYAVQLCDDG